MAAGDQFWILLGQPHAIGPSPDPKR